MSNTKPQSPQLKYYYRNQDKVREYQRKNKDKIQQYEKLYRIINAERLRIQQWIHRQQRMEKSPEITIDIPIKQQSRTVRSARNDPSWSWRY